MKKALYLGLDLPTEDPKAADKKEFIHCPVIEIRENPSTNPQIVNAFSNLLKYTHIILTSKVAAALFFKNLPLFSFSLQDLENQTFVAVGKATATSIAFHGIKNIRTAENECSEGVVELLENCVLEDSSFFWPCSALSRSIIPNYLAKRKIPYCTTPLYTTLTRQCKDEILLLLPIVDELIFTSPSTVNGFLDLFDVIPSDKMITPIGPITAAHLNKVNEKCKVLSQL